MWEARIASDAAQRQTVSLHRNERAVSYAEIVALWQHDAAFRDWFVARLAEAPYEAYFWETPPVTRATQERGFEFVWIDAPTLARTASDPADFQGHFDGAAPDQDVLTFPNLGGDALLVVPVPRAPHATYGHLGVFARQAPPAQQHSLWESTGAALQRRIGDRPVWLSTAGLGVSWLHLRLDDRPKYYRHAPYRRAAAPGAR